MLRRPSSSSRSLQDSCHATEVFKDFKLADQRLEVTQLSSNRFPRSRNQTDSTGFSSPLRDQGRPSSNQARSDQGRSSISSDRRKTASRISSSGVVSKGSSGKIRDISSVRSKQQSQKNSDRLVLKVVIRMVLFPSALTPQKDVGRSLSQTWSLPIWSSSW